MAKRPAHTLIFLGGNRTDRVDLDAAPSLAVSWKHHVDTHATDELPARLRSALSLGARVGKLVWILWEGAGSQVLDMPAAVVNGLDADQLADTLSFEAEPITGVPAADSAIAGIAQRNAPGALADFRHYWITQMNASLRDDLEQVVIAAKASLAGIVHPGGLPIEHWDGPLAGTNHREWRRIEIWDQLGISLHGRPDASVETRVIRGMPGSESWSAELPPEGTAFTWMGPGPVHRVSPEGRRAPDALTGVGGDGFHLEPVKIELPAGEVPELWLRAWGAELTAKNRRVPLIEPPSRRATPDRKFYILGGVLTAVVLLGCITHGMLLSSQISAAKDKADQLQAFKDKMSAPPDTKKEETQLAVENTAMKDRLADLDNQTATVSTEVDRREKLMNDFKAVQSRLGSLAQMHRPAIAALISALADAEKNDVTDVVVKEVRQEADGDLRISGLCKQTALADQFATRLDEQLTKSGWHVGAAQKQLRDDGLAYDFQVVLWPQVLVSGPTIADSSKPAVQTPVPGAVATRPGQSIAPVAGARR